MLSQEVTAEAETTKKDDSELRFLVRSILTHSDWDAIATAAAGGCLTTRIVYLNLKSITFDSVELCAMAHIFDWRC